MLFLKYKYYRYTFIFFISTLLLVSCDNKQNHEANTEIFNTSSEHWPRTIQLNQQQITLLHPPKRIVSTSVTITGTLLAINAPVIASGATTANTDVADQQGFFSQWADIAKQRQVTPLYRGEPDAELVASMQPDLIIISATGADSAIKLHSQLANIAPTIIINYDDKSWQQLAQQLGKITGHELDAQRIIKEFDQRLQQSKARLQLPMMPVSAFVYYEDHRGVNLWRPESAQGKLLTALGFQLATLPEYVKPVKLMGQRRDIWEIMGERMADGLTGQSFIIFAGNEATLKAIAANPFLQHLPAVANQRLYSMGLDTFRLDYYSAMNMLDKIERYFLIKDKK